MTSRPARPGCPRISRMTLACPRNCRRRKPTSQSRCRPNRKSGWSWRRPTSRPFPPEPPSNASGPALVGTRDRPLFFRLEAFRRRSSRAAPLLRDFLPVVQEPLQPDVRQGVLRHLLQDLERKRDDVRPELRGLDHVEGVAHGGDEDLALELVVPEDRDNLADDLHAVLAHVVEPPDERAHVLRPRLRGEDRLVRAEQDRKSTRLNSSHGYISYA